MQLKRTRCCTGVSQKKKSQCPERPDSFSVELCGKRLDCWSGRICILEKIMGFFLKGKGQRICEGKEKNELKKHKEMTSKARASRGR